LKTALDNTQDEGQERRRSYRLNDRIAMSYNVLTHNELPQAVGQFDELRGQLGLTNHFNQEKESYLPLLKQIKQANPSIASYLGLLEKKIDALANQLSIRNHALPNSPSRDVTLSAHGIRFFAERFILSNSQIELRIQLFPSCISLLVYATVVLCKKVDHQNPHHAYAITAEFSHIHESDKEALVKHIHEKQMLALRKKAERNHA